MAPSAPGSRRRQQAGWQPEADGDVAGGEPSGMRPARRQQWNIHWTNETTFTVEQEATGVDDEAVSDFVHSLEAQIETHFGENQPDLLASSINFSRNTLTDAGMRSVMTFFRRRRISVEKIKFFKNAIGDGGLEHVARMLAYASRPAHEIHISHNNVTDRGVRLFFTILAQSGKYPFPLEGTRHNSSQPLWLRLEKNCMDWNSVEVVLRQESIRWCTATSKDRWGPKENPPMFCIYKRQGISVDDEWMGQRSGAADPAEVPASASKAASVREADMLRGLLEAGRQDVTQVSSAEPTGQTAPRSSSGGGDVMAMLQKVAPGANLRRVSLDEKSDVVDVEYPGHQQLQQQLQYHASQGPQHLPPQKLSKKMQRELMKQMFKMEAMNQGAHQMSAGLSGLQYSQPQLGGSLAELAAKVRKMTEVVEVMSAVHKAKKEMPTESDMDPSWWGWHQPQLHEEMQLAHDMAPMATDATPLQRAKQALSLLPHYGDGDVHRRWSAHVEEAQDPEGEVLRIVDLCHRLSKMGYVKDVPLPGAATRRTTDFPPSEVLGRSAYSPVKVTPSATSDLVGGSAVFSGVDEPSSSFASEGDIVNSLNMLIGKQPLLSLSSTLSSPSAPSLNGGSSASSTARNGRSTASSTAHAAVHASAPSRLPANAGQRPAEASRTPAPSPSLSPVLAPAPSPAEVRVPVQLPTDTGDPPPVKAKKGKNKISSAFSTSTPGAGETAAVPSPPPGAQSSGAGSQESAPLFGSSRPAAGSDPGSVVSPSVLYQ